MGITPADHKTQTTFLTIWPVGLPDHAAGNARGNQNGNGHGTVPGTITHLKKRMTASLSSPRIFASVNNEKEVILCLVIKGLCRKALFLFGGLRSSLLGARETEPSRGKTNDKRFFDTRSRKRGFKPLFF